MLQRIGDDDNIAMGSFLITLVRSPFHSLHRLCGREGGPKACWGRSSGSDAGSGSSSLWVEGSSSHTASSLPALVIVKLTFGFGGILPVHHDRRFLCSRG
jgi:hypothetical protein